MALRALALSAPVPAAVTVMLQLPSERQLPVWELIQLLLLLFLLAVLLLLPPPPPPPPPPLLLRVKVQENGRKKATRRIGSDPRKFPS